VGSQVGCFFGAVEGGAELAEGEVDFGEVHEDVDFLGFGVGARGVEKFELDSVFVEDFVLD